MDRVIAVFILRALIVNDWAWGVPTNHHTCGVHEQYSDTGRSLYVLRLESFSSQSIINISYIIKLFTAFVLRRHILNVKHNACDKVEVNLIHININSIKFYL